MNIKFLTVLFFSVLTTISCNSQNTIQLLKPVEFKEKISNTPNVVVLDVRTKEEVESGFIENAININYNDNDFKTEIAKLDKDKVYVVYCLSGKRSASAASYMRSNGFKDVYNLDGGILAWQNENLPLVTTTNVADKISIEEYNKMITSDTKVLIDYYAPWCAPCIKMKPMLEELTKEYEGKVTIIRLDISENKQLAKQLNVVEIPVLKIFVDGKETWSHNGFIGKEELKKQL